MAGDDLNSLLIVPLITRAGPEGAGGSSPLSWPEGDTPIAEELAGELYVFYGFDLPGAFRLVSRRDCARMQLDAGDLRPIAVRNLTRRHGRPQIKQAPAAAMLAGRQPGIQPPAGRPPVGADRPSAARRTDRCSATARHAHRGRLTG